jgi:hypothetical protein
MGKIKVKSKCWLWFTKGYMNDGTVAGFVNVGVEQLQHTVHSHYICVNIHVGLKLKKVIIFYLVMHGLINMFDGVMCDAVVLVTYVIKSRFVFKRFCDDKGGRSIHKRVVLSGVVYKIVIKGLLLDNG